MVRDEILKAVKDILGEIILDFPENQDHGDYSTNIAFLLAKKEKKAPVIIANELVQKLNKDNKLPSLVSKIEVAGDGFINFWLTEKALIENLEKISHKKDNFGKSDVLKGKKYLIEHTSPNTIKSLHLGHVRNNALGMAVHNLLEFCGAFVKLDSINNDRGIHVMKAVWAYQKYAKGKTPKSEKVKSDKFVDQYYILGAKKAENPKMKEEMQELLRKWEAGDKGIRVVWKKLRDWTFEGFQLTYERLGSYHDRQWFESDFYQHGKEMVEMGLKKGVFKRLEDGAVLSILKKYNLTDSIILRSDGTSMYHTQDLYLTRLKRDRFPSDLYIWDIGPEQELYLKQLFAMCEQLGIGKVEDYMHLPYGFVYLKGKGKMSSRKGTIVSADWLIDEMVKRASKVIESSQTSRGLSKKEKNLVAEVVGIGAIKYSFLKPARLTDIHFDQEESIALEGNSGPYLQYTYARAQSVIRKALGSRDFSLMPNEAETLLLRSLIRFPEVIVDAAKNYSPNLICNYLFDLASKYNNFYAKERIIGSDNENFRLLLTASVGQVIKNGLLLLGIQAPKRM